MATSTSTRWLVVLATVVACVTAGCRTERPSDGAAKVSGTLRVWAWGTEGGRLQATADEFARVHPGLNVEVTSLPSSDAYAKLLASLAAGHGPDVAVVAVSHLTALARTGALDEAPATIRRERLLPAATSAVTVDGKAYGVPWFLETRVLYYRTDIAARAGISTPPETWGELKAAARAMQAKGGARYGIHLPTNSWQTFLPFIWQAGGELVRDGSVRFDSPEVAEAAAFYKSFVDEGLSPPVTREGFNIAPAFVRGTHPMFVSGPWQMSMIREAGGKAFESKWDVAPMPVNRRSASFLGGGIWTVLKRSSNRSAAWAFVEWMAQPEREARWYAITGGLPPTSAAWKLPPLSTDPRAKVFRKQLDSAVLAPRVPDWQAIGVAVESRFDSLLRSPSGGREIAQQLQVAAAAIGG